MVRVIHRGEAVEAPGRLRHVVDRAGDWRPRLQRIMDLRCEMLRHLCSKNPTGVAVAKKQLARVYAADAAVQREATVVEAPVPARTVAAAMRAAERDDRLRAGGELTNTDQQDMKYATAVAVCVSTNGGRDFSEPQSYHVSTFMPDAANVSRSEPSHSARSLPQCSRWRPRQWEGMNSTFSQVLLGSGFPPQRG